MRKVHTILFALGLIFLVFLILRIGVYQLWRQLTMLGWGLIPLILAEGLAEFFHAAAKEPFQFRTKAAPLRDVEALWETAESGTRLVFQP